MSEITTRLTASDSKAWSQRKHLSIVDVKVPNWILIVVLVAIISLNMIPWGMMLYTSSEYIVADNGNCDKVLFTYENKQYIPIDATIKDSYITMDSLVNSDKLVVKSNWKYIEGIKECITRNSFSYMIYISCFENDLYKVCDIHKKTNNCPPPPNDIYYFDEPTRTIFGGHLISNFSQVAPGVINYGDYSVNFDTFIATGVIGELINGIKSKTLCLTKINVPGLLQSTTYLDAVGAIGITINALSLILIVLGIIINKFCKEKIHERMFDKAHRVELTEGMLDDEHTSVLVTNI